MLSAAPWYLSYRSVAMPALAAIGDRFDAATLARLARRTPDPVLRAATIPPIRTSSSARSSPDAEPAEAIGRPPNTVIRWDIGDGPARELVPRFEEGRCRTTTRAPRRSRDHADGRHDFLRLATGAELPMAMFESGRIRISGDLFFAAQLQGMFEIPTATRPAR